MLEVLREDIFLDDFSLGIRVIQVKQMEHIMLLIEIIRSEEFFYRDLIFSNKI
jgi:hypothetical protein